MVKSYKSNMLPTKRRYVINDKIIHKKKRRQAKSLHKTDIGKQRLLKE